MCHPLPKGNSAASENCLSLIKTLACCKSQVALIHAAYYLSPRTSVSNWVDKPSLLQIRSGPEKGKCSLEFRDRFKSVDLGQKLNREELMLKTGLRNALREMQKCDN